MNTIQKVMVPVIEEYKKRIRGLTPEEMKIIAYDFIENLSVGLAESRIVEGIAQRKANRNKA